MNTPGATPSPRSEGVLSSEQLQPTVEAAPGDFSDSAPPCMRHFQLLLELEQHSIEVSELLSRAYSVIYAEQGIEAGVLDRGFAAGVFQSIEGRMLHLKVTRESMRERAALLESEIASRHG